MSPGIFLPAESDLDLFRRLTARHRNYLEESFPRWGTHHAESLSRQVANGSLSAMLWKGGGGACTGLALVTLPRSHGGLHGLWLEPSNPSALTEILSDAERDGGVPLVTVTDILPGIEPAAQSSTLGSMGFWHRQKVLMRRDSRNTLADRKSPPSEVRPIRPADLEAVVGLYVRAYTNRPGEFWTWGRPDNWVDARDDVMSHVDSHGDWNPAFLPEASFVWESAGRVLGAVLVDGRRVDCPYVEDLLVEPEVHRRGIGRALMEASIERMMREGSRKIELAAIRRGAPYRLYQRLEFEEVPPPEGTLDGHWVRGKSPF